MLMLGLFSKATVGVIPSLSGMIGKRWGGIFSRTSGGETPGTYLKAQIWCLSFPAQAVILNGGSSLTTIHFSARVGVIPARRHDAANFIGSSFRTSGDPWFVTCHAYDANIFPKRVRPWG